VTTITPVSPPPPDVPEHEPPAPGTTKAGRVRAGNSLLDGAILRAAIGESFVKLDPRTQLRNPVIFIVELGSVVTTVIFLGNGFDGFTGVAANPNGKPNSTVEMINIQPPTGWKWASGFSVSLPNILAVPSPRR